MRFAVAVGVSTASVVGLASPAWAPRIHRGNEGSEPCKSWQELQYKNHGECMKNFNGGSKK
jgi:hypothetical protein